MELVSGHESFLALSNRGALSILDASFRFGQASNLEAGEPWSTVRKEQRAIGEILPLPRDWGLCWPDVCICTDASEKGFAFAVREGCRELASEVGRVSERTRFKRSSRSIRARSRALSPALNESCTDFPEVLLQTSGSLGLERLTAYAAFFREENIILLDARPILYAVRFAENRYPPGLLLILSDNLALVPAFGKGRSKHFYIAFSYASFHCVWFQGRFCLVVQVGTLGIELHRQKKPFL